MSILETTEPYRTLTSLIYAEGSPGALNTFQLLNWLSIRVLSGCCYTRLASFSSGEHQHMI